MSFSSLLNLILIILLIAEVGRVCSILSRIEKLLLKFGGLDFLNEYNSFVKSSDFNEDCGKMYSVPDDVAKRIKKE